MDSEESKACTTAAVTLFALCVFLVIAIFLLNRSLLDTYAERTRLEAVYDEAESLVGKLEAYRLRNDHFFASLAESSLRLASRWCWAQPPCFPDHRLPGELQLFPGGGRYRWRSSSTKSRDSSVDRQLDSLRDPLRDQLFAFGRAAAAAFKQTNRHDTRLSLLAASLSTAVPDEGARTVLKPILPPLSQIDSPDEWSAIVNWLVYAVWPPHGGMSGFNPGERVVSYAERVAPGVDPRMDRDRDSHALYWSLRYTKGLPEADELLRIRWARANDDMHRASPIRSQLSLPGIGASSLRIEDLLTSTAPVLLFFQTLFWIYWERRVQKTQTGDRLFLFPAFQCPDDPLAPPTPHSLTEAAQRAIWLLFLILPTLILTMGVLNRYDVVRILDYGGWITLLIANRSYDGLSLSIDAITVACLALSVEIVASITTSRIAGQSSRMKLMFTVTLILILLLLPLSRTTCFWQNHTSHSLGLLLELAFGAVWFRALYKSLLGRARLLGVLSISGIVLYWLMLSRRCIVD